MYTYKTYTTITDNGPYTTKLILKLPAVVRDGQISRRTFSVFLQKLDPHTKKPYNSTFAPTVEGISSTEGYPEVLKAYVCDAKGNWAAESEYVALELPYGPAYPLTHEYDVFNFIGHKENPIMDWRITQVRRIGGEKGIYGLVFDRFDGNICPAEEGWKYAKSSYKKMPLEYGYYTPNKKAAKDRFTFRESRFDPALKRKFPSKLPLIVMLHGIGQGGHDPSVPVKSFNTTNLGLPELQYRVGGAAYVLVPQCPTYWMDNGECDVDINHEAYQNKDTIYTEALFECIDEFVKAHKDIDPKKIYVGGFSNGGFMTVKLVLEYPGYFAACMPMCELYRTTDLSDDDIKTIAQTPMWISQCRNDPAVPPECSPFMLYKRLKEAGAEVHMSFFSEIRDTSGLFKDREGKDFRYNSHFVWIYANNDYCQYDIDGSKVLVNGIPVTMYYWLGMQKAK